MDDRKGLQAGEPAGRSVEVFARETGSSRATIYRLPPEMQPHSVKLGRRRIITEAPREWLRRIAERQGAAA
jgi:predicted DNA-binding transcriptional regulator AlpA